MIVKTTKECDVKITFNKNKFYILISENDGYHCQVAELTETQAKILSCFIIRYIG